MEKKYKNAYAYELRRLPHRWSHLQPHTPSESVESHYSGFLARCLHSVGWTSCSRCLCAPPLLCLSPFCKKKIHTDMRKRHETGSIPRRYLFRCWCFRQPYLVVEYNIRMLNLCWLLNWKLTPDPIPTWESWLYEQANNKKHFKIPLKDYAVKSKRKKRSNLHTTLE